MKKFFNPLEANRMDDAERARRESLRLAAEKDAAGAACKPENAADTRERMAKDEPTQGRACESEEEKRHQQELIDAAARGAAIAADMPRERGPRQRVTVRLIAILVLLLALVIAVLLLYPKLRDAAGLPAVSISVPESLDELLPDETMGYNHIDFSEAILGEARERQELVVMEQDVDVPVQVTQALGNIDLFKKTRVIHSFGTGVYTVDLGKLNAACITSDDAAQLVTIRVPHTVLQYVNIDKEKTTFEETKKSIFAIGEIKLTAEQQQILDQTVSDAMYQKLTDSAMFLKADETALMKVQGIFQPLVTALADGYTVKIMMDS